MEIIGYCHFSSLISVCFQLKVHLLTNSSTAPSGLAGIKIFSFGPDFHFSASLKKTLFFAPLFTMDTGLTNIAITIIFRYIVQP